MDFSEITKITLITVQTKGIHAVPPGLLPCLIAEI